MSFQYRLFYLFITFFSSTVGLAMDGHVPSQQGAPVALPAVPAAAAAAPRRLAITYDPSFVSPVALPVAPAVAAAPRRLALTYVPSAEVIRLRVFMTRLLRLYTHDRPPAPTSNSWFQNNTTGQDLAAQRRSERLAPVRAIVPFRWEHIYRNHADRGIFVINNGNFDHIVDVQGLTVEQILTMTLIYLPPFVPRVEREHVPEIQFWLGRAELIARTWQDWLLIGQRYTDLFHLDSLDGTGSRDAFRRSALSAFSRAGSDAARWARAELVLRSERSTDAEAREAMAVYERAYHEGTLSRATEISTTYRDAFERRFWGNLGLFDPAVTLAYGYLNGRYIEGYDVFAADIALGFFSYRNDRHLLNRNFTPALQSFFFGRISDILRTSRHSFLPDQFAMLAVITRLALDNRAGLSFDAAPERDDRSHVSNAPLFGR